MPKAIRFHQPGGPEVLVWEEVPVGDPGLGEARVRHKAVGLNFVDVYVRKGLYPVPLPSGLGTEAAGVVEAIGPGVTEVEAGDRVAFSPRPPRAFSQERVWRQYLMRKIPGVPMGDTILFHAVAGGVGLIACQWAKALSATVMGTVG